MASSRAYLIFEESSPFFSSAKRPIQSSLCHLKRAVLLVLLLLIEVMTTLEKLTI